MNYIAVTQTRNRYIAFIIKCKSSVHFQRNDIINALQSHCVQQYHTHPKSFGFFLTRFKDNKGIFRCYHTEKNRAISFLQSLENINHHGVKIITIGTSGTIKALIKKHLEGNTLQD